MHRYLRPIVALALAAVTLTGCGTKANPPGGSPRPKNFFAVVSLSPSTSETFFATERSQIVVGRTASCDFPLTLGTVEVVAKVKPDYEKLARLKPDLILYDKALYSDADIQKMKTLGAEVFEWNPKSLMEYRAKLVELAGMLGGESATSKYLDKVDVEINTAKQRASGKAAKTAAVILPGPNGQHMWVGTESFQASELAAAGLSAVGPKGGLFVPIDAESLIKLNPDVIVLATKTPDEFIKDQRFAGLKAMKAGAVVGMNPDIALRTGCRVDVFIGALSKLAYGQK